MCKNCYGTGKVRKKVMPGVYTFEKCSCELSKILKRMSELMNDGDKV